MLILAEFKQGLIMSYQKYRNDIITGVCLLVVALGLIGCAGVLATMLVG